VLLCLLYVVRVLEPSDILIIAVIPGAGCEVGQEFRAVRIEDTAATADLMFVQTATVIPTWAAVLRAGARGIGLGIERWRADSG
jgi:hypothetical protein